MDRDQIQEDIAIYPYTRRQLNHIIRNPQINRGVKIIQDNIVPFWIKEYLHQMQYDFRYSSSYRQWNKYKRNYRVRIFRRPYYLRFKCLNCNGDKKWTTTAGTFQIKFLMIPLKSFLKQKQYKKLTQKKNLQNPLIIIFKYRTYKMQCIQCKQWGKIQHYKPILAAISRLFCRIIAEIINNIDPPIFEGQGRQLLGHKDDLCQACKLGVCVALRRRQ